MKKFFLVTIIFLTLTSNSFAYLDPGTGSYLLSLIAMILAGIVSVYTFLKLKVKNFFNKFKKKNEENLK